MDDEPAEAPKPREPEPLPEATPCSTDLLATVYKSANNSRAAQFHARDACKYPSDVLEKAKKLFLDGYGNNFGITLSTVKNATPEQLACAQKRYDKPKNGAFRMPHLCLQKAELIACTDDLTAALKDESDARTECERRSPEVIAKAKAIFLEKKYGDAFNQICDAVENATAEQLECIKRDFEYRSNGFTRYESFSHRGVCLREPETFDCYFELFDGVLKEKRGDDRFRVEVENACAHHLAAVPLAVEIAKNGYTGWFPRLVSDIDELKPDKRDCLQKNFKQMPEKDRFYLPKVCEKK